MVRKIFYSIVVLFLCEAGLLCEESITIAPFIGHRFGGSFRNLQTGGSCQVDARRSFGGTISIKLPWELDWLEFLYSSQNTEIVKGGLSQSIDIAIEEWQLGILREFETEFEKLRPYSVGLLGVTNLKFAHGQDNRNLFSLGLGLGTKYYITSHVALRCDVRGFVSLYDGQTIFRFSSDTGGVIQYQGNGFFQGEMAASLTVYF